MALQLCLHFFTTPTAKTGSSGFSIYKKLFKYRRILKTTITIAGTLLSLAWKYLHLGLKKVHHLNNDKIIGSILVRFVCTGHSSSLFNCSDSMEIQTFVFIDCETTGLPFQEYYKTKVTELSLAAVESNHLSLGVYPRVLNKISLCFNPRKMISPMSTEITGLSNDLLEFQPSFNEATVEILKNFLGLCRKPVCFVAHNGFCFDYPILRSEIEKSNSFLDPDILCCDTLPMFRSMHKQELEDRTIQLNKVPIEFQDDFDSILLDAVESLERKERMENIQKRNESTPKKNISKVSIDESDASHLYYVPGGNDCSSTGKNRPLPAAKKQLKLGNLSFKLGDVYQRLAKKEVVDAHRAESDITMLLECAAILNEKFIKLANESCKKFSEIPCMGPKSKMGS